MEDGKKEIIFISKEHEDFFFKSLDKVRYQDCYHIALCYCLGISADTRNFVDHIYDFKTGLVKPECLREGWQTSGSGRIIRMAFNLYCNGTPSILGIHKNEDKLEECMRYTVEDLFCSSYAPYFWQAIQLRYPEYTQDKGRVRFSLGTVD